MVRIVSNYRFWNGFEGGILVLIAPRSGHCISVAFPYIKSWKFREECYFEFPLFIYTLSNCISGNVFKI